MAQPLVVNLYFSSGGLALTGIKRLKKTTATVMAILIASTVIIPSPNLQLWAVSTASLNAAASNETNDISLSIFDSNSYGDYIKQYGNKAKPREEIILKATDYTLTDGAGFRNLDNYEGMMGSSLFMDEQGTVEWKVNIKEEGMYNISALYYPVEGKSADIERTLLIDGVLPFKEAAYLQFSRIWDNTLPELRQDNQGNDLRPQQQENPVWTESIFKDSAGYYNEPFQFYFSAGQHTLSLKSQREPMVINELRIYQEQSFPDYVSALKQYQDEGLKETEGLLIEIEGEDAVAKSSPTLYPVSERSSPAVYPYSPSLVKINSIGGYNWRIPGQWVEWEVDVPESGLYKIGFKAKQNFVRGIYSTRKLMIDGQIPFEEMNNVAFKYKTGYRLDVMQDEQGNPYLYKLEQGKHTLRLEVTLGEFAPLIKEIEESLFNLNEMYRKILMITGTTPDEVRDYRVEQQIPNLIETFQSESDRLKNIANQLQEMSGNSSDDTALLKTMYAQLDEMIAKPDTIHRRLTAYKTNTGGLGTWIQKAREMPLQVDTVYVASPSEKLPNKGLGFFSKLWHEILTFIYSFFIDYNQIGNLSDGKEERSVTVWIGSGRDQANTIKAMIDESFTADTGITINLKLVQMNTLLSATLSGQGPDVAMTISNDLPVNYAMRNATTDLTQFADFEEVSERFRDSALVPYSYMDGVYALPEQQTFNMLFYRKDVMRELGLPIPQTWDDVSNLLAVLNKNHMEFGLPLTLVPTYPGENIPPNSIYATLLLQAGGSFYTEGGKRSALDSRTAIESFKTWTEFYTDYKLEKEYDFANRFRTGQMPIGIADYTVYNQLMVFAPEIRGMWGFAPIPGTETETGEIHRELPSGGNGIVMMEAAEDKNAAWEFMKWWTNEETQIKYGREMEGLMGAAARLPTANIKALDSLAWPVEDYKNLKEQFEWVQGVPEVPGGYFTGRHLLNAFYKVINNKVDPREAIMDYTQYIQDEITTKRAEFGLKD